MEEKVKKRQPDVFIGDLVNNDFIAMLSPVLGSQYYIRDSDRKITCDVKVDTTTPWIHVRTDPTRYCKLWHDVFNCFGFIPTQCLNCWKVVAKPHTLEQQFELLTVMDEDITGPCKIGIEHRKYVRGHYGAYFYNNSYREGREKYMEVYLAMEANPILAPLLSEVNDKGVTTRLILKRFCSEFELGMGPSNQYRPPPNAEMWEKRIKDRFAMPALGVNQPDDLKEHVKRKWVEFAWERDDPTAEQYNNNQPLYTPLVTYHKKVVKGVMSDE